MTKSQATATMLGAVTALLAGFIAAAEKGHGFEAALFLLIIGLCYKLRDCEQERIAEQRRTNALRLGLQQATDVLNEMSGRRVLRYASVEQIEQGMPAVIRDEGIYVGQERRATTFAAAAKPKRKPRKAKT